MNPYNVLGVKSDADIDAIKASFRRLASKHHPDREGGDTEKFKEVQKAYEVLSDPEKRAQYDQYGHKPNPHETTDRIITEVLVNLIESDRFDVRYQDMVSAIRSHFVNQMSNIRQAMKESRKASKKYRVTSKRMKAVNKILFDTLYAKRRQNLINTRAMREQYQMGTRAIERLKDYKYETETLIVPTYATARNHGSYTTFNMA